MIRIKRSPTADSRTCDPMTVSKETLLKSSIEHIGDVRRALEFFIDELHMAGVAHDVDKIGDVEGFHRDFQGGEGFTKKAWYQNHIKVNRHHLLEPGGCPDDVNLIDVLDMVADCVMAGMARSGDVYPFPQEKLPELLTKAFNNTVELLKQNVEVAE